MPRKNTIHIFHPEEYDETTDEECEEIWMSICATAASKTGISPERAKSILDSAGFYAFGHTGVVEAVEVVVDAVGQKRLSQGHRLAIM